MRAEVNQTQKLIELALIREYGPAKSITDFEWVCSACNLPDRNCDGCVCDCPHFHHNHPERHPHPAREVSRVCK